jgi:hypothetical protein
MNSLFIFVDESWNMDFSEKWTKHFIFSALITTKPLESSQELQKLKYELLTKRNWWSILQNFHATEDLQYIRNLVFDYINRMQNLFINWIICEKNKVKKEFRTRWEFYSLLW